MRQPLFLLLLCGALSVLCPVSASAREYLVLPDGSGTYATIQEAIDGAVDGDVIVLGYGRFTGPGNHSLSYRGKSIAIRSQSGHPETCIIDCEGSPTNYVRAISFDGEGPGAILRDVTIERGYKDNGDYGGGVYFNNASPTLIHVTIRNCGAFLGGGFAGRYSSPTFKWCRIEDSGACGYGAGIIGHGSPTFTDCEFIGNHGNQSGGGVCVSDCNATFIRCLFADNDIDWDTGGGLLVIEGSANVNGCTFINNTIGRGRGTRCVPPPGVIPSKLEELWSRGGRLEYGGGAVGLWWAAGTLSDCTIVGNSSFGTSGGGITLFGSSAALAMNNCILAFNTGGGAVVCDSQGATVSVSCSDIYANVGGDWTGCIGDLAGVDGNISADPLFCDLPGRDFTIRPNSPCAPGQSGECGLMGSEPAMCGVVAAENQPVALGPPALRIIPNPTAAACRVEMWGITGPELFVTVTDVMGRRVRELSARPEIIQHRASTSAYWDGLDMAGRPVPSGLYFVKARTAAGTRTRTVVMAR